jgi:hypothetical protein
MRTILTLSAVVVLAAACAPRPHPYPVAEAPYLLHVPAPGTDYRYRSGSQGFGRTGPVYSPGPSYRPYGAGYVDAGSYQARPYVPPLEYGYGYEYEAYGEGPPVHGYSDAYSWGDRRHSVRGGSSYQSREMMTEETYITGGVIVEREAQNEPRRSAPYRDTSGYPSYPGPYAESPWFEPPPPVEPDHTQRPYPDAGPEPFY